jgi:hypothetical protein
VSLVETKVTEATLRSAGTEGADAGVGGRLLAELAELATAGLLAGGRVVVAVVVGAGVNPHPLARAISAPLTAKSVRADRLRLDIWNLTFRRDATLLPLDDAS